MSFETLGLHESLLKAVREAGYENATEVQAQAIPAALAGADLMVSSQTGSGKTAAFILPALTKILASRADNDKRRRAGEGPGGDRVRGKVYGPRILVLAPTRELAMQVAKAAQTYGRHIPGLKVATVLGGVPYGLQIRQLTGPLDILIATPGRLIDHIESGKCVLENVEMLVLDEADRMLDMGFIDDIHFVAGRTPPTRQTVMFSATFAGSTGRLAQELLKEPQRIEVASHREAHTSITQRLHWADNPHHKDRLLEAILAEPTLDQAVVFTSTQRDADWLAERLAEIGHAVAPLHGAMPQGKRNRVLRALRERELRVLVATDVAARGIDVPTITHVINYGLPMKAEDYVHRIGRTGRAGREGLAITLGLRDDISMIRRIQQFTTQEIPVQHIAGLEPKTQEPRIFMGPRPGAADGRPSFGRKNFNRTDSRPGQRPAGKPFGGQAFGRDNGPSHFNREGGPSHFNREGGPAHFNRDAGHGGNGGPRRDDRRPFDRQFDRQFDRADRPAHAGREDRGFQPRFEERSFAPRGDRPFTPGGKPAGARPAFGGERRGPGGPGPRKGGYGR
ncbi:DEAD/DEAH box helicase [Roseateles paludis]|jgi:superfamily II DNA/RNA helicase|uniref:DEAD/DEAH box helicase n=1 Tax=Roseateles paludis TaxID=3145238 RepID=A0ABV0G3D5_9BURK